jgi:hypothetical protein
MARLENLGIFPTEGFDVTDWERWAWEAFEGRRTVIVRLDSNRRPLPEAQDRHEKRKKHDALLKLDLSNHPIKFAARQLLGWVLVFHEQRQRRDIALKAAGGDREALKQYIEAWKRELLESAPLIQIEAPESLQSALPRRRWRKFAQVLRSLKSQERAELVREVNLLEGNLRSLEATIIALGREINWLEFHSRSKKSLKSLERRIKKQIKRRDRELQAAADREALTKQFFEGKVFQTVGVTQSYVASTLGKNDALQAFESGALSRAISRKDSRKGHKEQSRDRKEKRDELLRIFGDLKSKEQKKPPEVTRRSDRQLFKATREEYKKRKELTAEEIKKLPKDDAFYKWLRAKAQKRSTHAA